jgi:hypothetical protein
MRNPDIPAIERLPLIETVRDYGWSLARTAGRVVLATVEGAIDGAFNSAVGQFELCRLEQDDKIQSMQEIEQHANNLEAHKNL